MTTVAGTAAAISDPVIGLKLKQRYLIEKLIGAGGFGAVYLARDLELLSKPVVVKLLLEKSLQREWVVTKFQHEIEALTRIDHPGVVGVLATGSMPDGSPFIVMEYVEGRSLRSIMEASPEGMDLVQVTHIVHQIGYALNAAHQKGIVHRDLKPENVMVRSLSGNEEQVKIIDFGIAKVRNSCLAPSTVVAETVGTVVYMSPEQLNAQTVFAATDIYSLGILTYEMLTGRRPFNPATMFQLNEIQREGVKIKPGDLRRSIPPPVDEVVLKALAYEPENRFISASKFADAFAEAMMEGTISASRHAPGIAKTVNLQTVRATPPSKISIPISGRRKLWLLVPLIFILTGIAFASIWKLTKGFGTKTDPAVSIQPATTAASEPIVARSIDYYLMVQKYLPNGKPHQDPFKATGNDTLANGWRFNVHISSPESGFLYLINEGPAGGTTTYNLLYPAPKYNNGSAWVNAGQSCEVGPYQLDTNQGREKFWLVWSKSIVPELEAVKGVVNARDGGTISDPQRVQDIHTLLSSHWVARPDVEIDKSNYVVHVRSKSDVLVNLIELEHR